MRGDKLQFFAPMLAKSGHEAPPVGKWIYEVKWDGIRAIAIKKGGETCLYSRRGRDLTQDYPEIAAALQNLKASQFSLDGEIVALDGEGHSSFQVLQNAKRTPSARNHIFYHVFDLTHLNGRNTMGMPLVVRRHFLREIIPGDGGRLRYSESLPGPSQSILKLAQKLGLEGIMAKRQDSKYETGQRSGAWLKIKAVNQQEFVIGGYTLPEGHQETMGALLVGYYEKNQLKYAGKVGAGFNVATLHELHARFQKLKTWRCPFANLPATWRDRAHGELSHGELAGLTWVEPRMVCEVKFSEWTNNKSLRQPVYLGLREDKEPAEVVWELSNEADGPHKSD
jgi:bifunctional non-homologous end joining protein LigD